MERSARPIGMPSSPQTVQPEGEATRVAARIVALARYGVMDTGAEELDDLASLAAETCEAPIAAISFADADRLWHKAAVGVDAPHSELRGSPCAATVALGEALLVEDAQADPRFAGHSLVHGPPRLRFFAGEPLLPANGPAIGALWVGDPEPRRFPSTHAFALRVIARQVITQLELRRASRLLVELHPLDAMTGLPSRRVLEQQLPLAIARGIRSAQPLSLAVLDVDLLGRFNDEWGRPAGDELLRAIVEAWRPMTRESDLLVRHGGGEFALLLNDCSLARAVAVIERLRGRVPPEATCSAGVAGWDGEEAPETLLRRADAACYDAKRRGRDRVVVAEELRR
jgi:diguanylate cyclase (GGDEF)-like protein